MQIAPDDFRKQSYVAIEDNINTKYANRVRHDSICHTLRFLTIPQVVQKIGLCICLWDILWTSEGLIGQGDGLVNVNGTHSRSILAASCTDTLCSRVPHGGIPAIQGRGHCSTHRGSVSGGDTSSVHLFHLSVFCLTSANYVLTVATDFFDDIFVPWTELPEGSEL